jgi:predicted HTH transcriptional regulator
MRAKELIKVIRGGETTTVQFKRELDSQDKIAAEMIAMANAKGGIIIFGVEDKTGHVVGLEYADLQSTSNKIATIANELIKPLIFIFTEVVTIENEAGEKKVLIVTIDEGTAKPYKDKNGTIWMKQGADKRKVTDNNEILRLFQEQGMAFVDEMIVADTSVTDINKDKVTDYIKRLRHDSDESENILNDVLYQNLGIIKNMKLTLGGLLFFSKNPQKYKPAFCVKAVSFYGNSIGGLHYRDSRDMVGTIPDLYLESMLFFKHNLRHEQKGQNFNSVGILEISEIALEELLQNALIHRDYTQNSPIRLMIFDDRIEIVSPGCLPNNLTVEKIKLGYAIVRNNLLASYSSKLLRYRGFGSGIIRALNEQPDIEFTNDVEGNQFIVKIPRETEKI